MKKYKNVKALKARRCKAFCETYGSMKNVCIGVKEIFQASCDGYCCKCTEYDYKRSVKHNESENT